MNLNEEANICRRKIAILNKVIKRFKDENADKAVSVLEVMLRIQTERLSDLESNMPQSVHRESKREDGYQPQRETLAADSMDDEFLEMF